MIEGIDKGKCGGAVEGPSVVQSGGDAHRRLVGVGDAEVDFPHGVDAKRSVRGPRSFGVCGFGLRRRGRRRRLGRRKKKKKKKNKKKG